MALHALAGEGTFSNVNAAAISGKLDVILERTQMHLLRCATNISSICYLRPRGRGIKSIAPALAVMIPAATNLVKQRYKGLECLSAFRSRKTIALSVPLSHGFPVGVVRPFTLSRFDVCAYDKLFSKASAKSVSSFMCSKLIPLMINCCFEKAIPNGHADARLKICRSMDWFYGRGIAG